MLPTVDNLEFPFLRFFLKITVVSPIEDTIVPGEDDRRLSSRFSICSWLWNRPFLWPQRIDSQG